MPLEDYDILEEAATILFLDSLAECAEKGHDWNPEKFCSRCGLDVSEDIEQC